MLANSTYSQVAVGLVVLAVVLTIWLLASGAAGYLFDLAIPSRRRARQERNRLERKAAAQRRQHRAELRMAPLLWEEERRRAERLVEYAEGQAGSEQLR